MNVLRTRNSSFFSLINGPTGIVCSKIAVQEADDQQALLHNPLLFITS
jgi:hypothetical protein